MSNIFIRKSSKIQPGGRFGDLTANSPPKSERWSKQMEESTGYSSPTDSSYTDESNSKPRFKTNYSKTTDANIRQTPQKTTRWGSIQNELEEERERELERDDERSEKGNRFIKSQQNLNGNYHRRQTFNYSKKTKVEPPKLFDLEKEEETNSFPALG